MQTVKTTFSLFLLITTLLTVLSACDNSVSAEKSWQQTVTLDTAQAYNDFLRRFPNHPKAPEAKRALREVVFIPYLGYVGDIADRPPLDKLMVPEQVLKMPANHIFDKTFNTEKTSFPYISINGQDFRLSKPEYNGKEIVTAQFGKLRCVLAQKGFGDKAQTMIFYLGGLRSQRDKIIATVSDNT